MSAAPDVFDDVLRSDSIDDPAWSAASEPQRARRTAGRRRRWGKEASVAALGLGALGGFLALTWVITGKRGTSVDRALMRAIGRTRHPANHAIARGVTFLGGVTGATAVATSAVMMARRRPRLAVQVAVGALGGVIAELGLKRFFRRERPRLLAHLERVTSTSFPSGHSMTAASLYLTLAFVAARSRRLRSHRAAVLATAASVAGAIGTSRVYLGVHWPTDVLGGLALGTAWASGVEAIFDLSAAGRVERDIVALPEVVTP